MARIEPFRAIRYSQSDISDLIAPPYDILSQEDKDALLDTDDHNIVAIDLPHVPPKTAGPDSVYAQAAGDLTSWFDIRVLAHDPQPAFYAYHQTYTLGNKKLTRKKIFCRLRLDPFGAGTVFPHEETFGGPKEDRLKLTTATRCNISPIFALYPDPENEVSRLVDEAIEREPDQVGTLGGVENKLWVINDVPTVKSIQVRLADKPIFIADGHHRYGTALMYREQQIEGIGPPTEDDPINYVLAVLGGMEDPGATIRPYFRAVVDLPRLTANALQAALSEHFDWKPITAPANQEDLEALLAEASPSAMALYVAKDDACAVVSPKDPDLLAPFEPDHGTAWRRLAYSILHHFIMDRVLRTKFNGGKEPITHYHKSLSEAVDDAQQNAGLAALVPATTMDQLQDICTAGELMPQKSTYFYPKLATGFVINPLY